MERYREKPVDRSRPRPRHEGNGRSRKRISGANIALDWSSSNGSPINEKSFGLDLRQYSTRKAGGTPIKTLISEEMSKEVEVRRSSPSLVARLMGLDTVPHQQFIRGEKVEMKSCFQETPSVECHWKYSPIEDHSIRKSTDEHQDFKDVFEVIETAKGEKYKKEQLGNRISNLKQIETDMAFIRQKFMDAKRLSADETLHQSTDFNDALEVLDSNKDLFLKFLEEPNSLFTKHLQDLKCSQPSSHVSHITILKSSKGEKNESSGARCNSGRNGKRCTSVPKEAKRSPGKEPTTVSSHCHRDHNSTHSHKLPKAHYAGKFSACSTPTRIVVLKPSLEKARNMAASSLSRSDEDLELVYTMKKGIRRSAVQESYAEGNGRLQASDDVRRDHRTKGSREIAREVTEKMRHVGNRHSKKVSNSGGDMLCYSEAFKSTSGHFDVSSNGFSSSSPYSAETLVSREARKRLSERWRTTNLCLESGFARGSSTLGEMLALSDKDVPDTATDSFSIQKNSDATVSTADVGIAWGRPSGISSRDGWKEARSRSLRRSVSLPSSSAVYDIENPCSTGRPVGSSHCYSVKDVVDLGLDDALENSVSQKGSSSHKSYKCRCHKPCSSNSGEEIMLFEREIHVNTEQMGNAFGEEEPVPSEIFEHTVADKEYLVGNSSLTKNDSVMPILSSGNEALQQMEATVLESPQSFGYDHKDMGSIMLEETSRGNLELHCLSSYSQLTESVLPVSCKEVEQPSPVSVLEPPSEEEISSSGCFGKISADLKELRMQLRLLKMDSAETHAEDLELVLSSDEDTRGNFDPFPEMEEMVQTVRGEDNTEFSYLLDVLNESGFRAADLCNLSDAYHSPQCPVCPDLFNKLEKKYSIKMSWSRSDRKLLFDLINFVLVEIGSPSLDLYHWAKPKRRFCLTLTYEALVKEVWEMLLQHRKELSSNLEMVLEPKCFDIGNSTYLLRRELEEMVLEDLLQELLSETPLW